MIPQAQNPCKKKHQSAGCPSLSLSLLCQHPDGGFSASRAVRNKCLLFKPQTMVFCYTAELTETDSIPLIFQLCFLLSWNHSQTNLPLHGGAPAGASCKLTAHHLGRASFSLPIKFQQSKQLQQNIAETIFRLIRIQCCQPGPDHIHTHA